MQYQDDDLHHIQQTLYQKTTRWVTRHSTALIESRPYRVLELETKLSDLSGQVYQQEELQNKVKRLNEELLFWYVLS